jgi:cell division protein FtsQ
MAILVLLMGGFGVYLTLRLHPRFAVNRVVLEGIPESRRAEAEELTDGWIGKPLLFADIAGPVTALSGRPWVASASARRVVPDTVVVRIVARPPVALARKGGEIWTVDRSGVWLGPYAGRGVGRDDDFVVIDPGETPDGVARGAAFLETLRTEDPELLARVSELGVNPDGFRLVDRVARATLLFAPDADEPGRAAPIWRAFLALRPELERHALTTAEVDLRFADRIVLKAPADSERGKT